MRVVEWNIKSGLHRNRCSRLENASVVNESKAIAHFQQVMGNVLNQLFFYIPFVCLFLSSNQVKDVWVFQQVIGKVTLRCRKRGCEIVYLIIADLSAVQVGFNLYFKDIAAPAHFYGLLHVPIAYAQW